MFFNAEKILLTLEAETYASCFDHSLEAFDLSTTTFLGAASWVPHLTPKRLDTGKRTRPIMFKLPDKRMRIEIRNRFLIFCLCAKNSAFYPLNTGIGALERTSYSKGANTVDALWELGRQA